VGAASAVDDVVDGDEPLDTEIDPVGSVEISFFEVDAPAVLVAAVALPVIDPGPCGPDAV